jgi:hypothetical protein
MKSVASQIFHDLTLAVHTSARRRHALQLLLLGTMAERFKKKVSILPCESCCIFTKKHSLALCLHCCTFTRSHAIDSESQTQDLTVYGNIDIMTSHGHRPTANYTGRLQGGSPHRYSYSVPIWSAPKWLGVGPWR